MAWSKTEDFKKRQAVPAAALKKALSKLSSVEFAKVASTKSVYVVLANGEEHRIADHTSPRKSGLPFLLANDWMTDADELADAIETISATDAELFRKEIKKIADSIAARKAAAQKRAKSAVATKEQLKKELVEKATKLDGIAGVKSLSIFGKILRKNPEFAAELRSAKLWGARWDIMFAAAKKAKK